MRHFQALRLTISFVFLAIIIALLPTTSKAADALSQKQEQPIQRQELIDEDTQTCTPVYTDAEAVMVAKVLYNEARGISSETEKACIVWVILNRVDAGYADTISGVITARNQFAYKASTPVWDNLLSLSYDVLSRWQNEKDGQTDVGRVLPSDYRWYTGNGLHNLFRNSYAGGRRWNYSLPSPYTN